MQKKLLKLSTIIGIILLVSMLILSVECFAVPANNTTSASDIVVGENVAENDETVSDETASNEVDSSENEDTYWDETIDGENVDSEDENSETLLDEEAEVTEEDVEDEVYTDTTTTTSSNNDSEDKIPSKIGSYSTGSTLPEANLGLNNILNIILIAVGAIIILLAIAILIRLKH